MSKINIVNLESENYSEKAATLLKTCGNLSLHNFQSVEDASKALEFADIVISRLRFILDEKLLSKAKNLKIVATPTTGTDHVDTDYLEKRGVKFIALKGERLFLDNIFATAEFTIALTMSLMRNVNSAQNSVLKGNWSRDLFKGFELEGKTVGIIGLGRLGTRVAHYFNAFGAHIVANDIKKVAHKPYVKLKSIEALLSESDIVSLHIDYSRDNYHFINSEKLSLIKEGAFFINSSRGGCVDEKALYDALVSNRLRGAAIDVMEGELDGSFKTSPLFEYARKNSNLIISPHIGGATFESMEKTEIFIAEKIVKEISSF